ncbi:hypothetical protein [Limnoglobus roseus]|uniref:Glycosyltransferase RgtA/B/C/D-like domain-containing protein n=1 Tax=Limnoglobus roseus TaxID=2598579 RepID=A0A5C1A7D6_9BACT|nr:hypothetical protein [Limnoglobus roseus]QEL14107.1 hypothetical protein PX52LOC_00971 [Limnoglobus roseus]
MPTRRTAWTAVRTRMMAANWYFVTSFWAILAVVFLKYPSVTWRVEIFAETGTNFFVPSLYDSFWANLKMPEYNYMAMVQRLLALMTVKVFGIVDHFPQAIQMQAVVLVALLCSMFTLERFRILLADDVCRLLVCLTIGFGAFATYQEYTFVNFIYFGIIYLVLAPFLDLARMSWLKYGATIAVTALIVLSKAMFLAAGPAYGMMAARAVYLRRWREAGLYAAGLAAAVLQFAYMQAHPAVFAGMKGTEFAKNNPFTVTADWAQIHVNTITAEFAQHNHLRPRDPVMAFALGVAFLAVLGGELLRRVHRPVLVFVVLCNAVAAVSVVLYDLITPVPSTWFKGVDFTIGRHAFFFNVLVLLSVAVAVLNLIKDRVLRRLFLAAVAFPFAVYHPDPGDWYPDARMPSSQWRQYRHLIHENEFVIPVNPPGWFLTRNMVVLAEHKTPLPPQSGLDVARLFPASIGWDVRGVFLRTELLPPGTPAIPIEVTAINPDGTEKARAKRLTRPWCAWHYFLFDQGVCPARLRFQDPTGKPIEVAPHELFVFGHFRSPVLTSDATEPVAHIHGELQTGMVLAQRFVASDPGLCAVSVMVGNYNRVNTCQLRFRLWDEEAGVKVAEDVVSAATLSLASNHSTIVFTFPAIPGSRGKRYRYEIDSPDGRPGNAIVVIAGTPPTGQPPATFNGQSTNNLINNRFSYCPTP